MEIAEGLTIERYEDADAVIDACAPRGLNHNPARQFGQLYSFVDRTTEFDPHHIFELNTRIKDALSISRLVSPNSHCTEYAGRIIDGHLANGERIVAPVLPSSRFYAFIPPVDRYWLEPEQARDLGPLLARYQDIKGTASSRITNALWSCEYSAREYYREIAGVLVASGLESLLKTQRTKITSQFATRVVALAEHLQIAGVSDRTARDFYDERSGTVHGSPEPVGDESDANQRFGTFQRLLQVTLRRAIENDEFAAVFKNEATINERFPWEA